MNERSENVALVAGAQARWAICIELPSNLARQHKLGRHTEDYLRKRHAENHHSA